MFLTVLPVLSLWELRISTEKEDKLALANNKKPECNVESWGIQALACVLLTCAHGLKFLEKKVF